MHIIAINGSPRGAGHNTFIMVEEFLKGANDAGATSEHILLAGKKINHCIGCFSCWLKTPGVCVFKDDMAPILEKLKAHRGILVFATPLYVDNVTGLMKNFFDRMIPIASPYFKPDEHGECRHLMEGGGAMPRLVVISNCGFPEQTHFEALKVLFRRMARNFSSEVIAEIYRGEGELLKSTNLFLRPFLYKYKKLIQKCGREVVQEGKLSDETKAALEKPIIPVDMYIKNANKYWKKELGKIAK